MMEAGNRVLNLLCSEVHFFDAEKRIVNFILTHQEQAVNMTLAELARSGNSSEATVSRLCKKLGFDNYRSFQLALARDVLEESRSGLISNEVSLDNLNQSLHNILANKISELSATINAIDAQTLRSVLDILCRAHFTEVAAVGNTIPVALDAAFKFNQLGLRCSTEMILEKQAALALTLTAQDALLVISHSGRSRRLLAVAQIARAAGAPVILITNDPGSPLAQTANHILISANREALLTTREFSFSRISAIAVVEVLYHFLLVSLPGARDNIRRHEETMRPDKNVI